MSKPETDLGESTSRSRPGRRRAMARRGRRVLGVRPSARSEAELVSELPPPVMHRIHPGLQRVRDHIHVHYASKITTDELERVSGLTRYHLVRTFRAVFGFPPHAYQVRLRLAHACAQLRTGARIRDLDVGFSDQSHLIRHFKRVLGLTPGQYARWLRVQEPDRKNVQYGRRQRSVKSGTNRIG